MRSRRPISFNNQRRFVNNLCLNGALNRKGVKEWWIEHKDGEKLAGRYTAPAGAQSEALKTQTKEDPDAVTLQVWVYKDTGKAVLLRTVAGVEFFVPKSVVTLRPRGDDSYDAIIPGFKVKEIGLQADGTTAQSRKNAQEDAKEEAEGTVPF